MKNRLFRVAVSSVLVASLTAAAPLAAMADDVTTAQDENLGDREAINFWFWGAEPYAQEAMKTLLVDKYNASQDKYQLVVEFRPSVDSDMTTALAANQGPDIVYGSGPSFVMPLVEAGKLEPMDSYSEQYGWKDKILEPYYESGTVNGTLYSLVNGVSTMGVFYNKKVLADNGWEVPKTIEDLEKIMDEALEKGMYASVTGNKGWQPVNENYASLFLTHIATPDTMYKVLTGEESWVNDDVKAQIEARVQLLERHMQDREQSAAAFTAFLKRLEGYKEALRTAVEAGDERA